MRHHSRDLFRPNDIENVLPIYDRVTRQDGKKLVDVVTLQNGHPVGSG